MDGMLLTIPLAGDAFCALAAQTTHIIAVSYRPANVLLRVASVSEFGWLTSFAVSACILVATKIFKVIRHCRKTACTPVRLGKVARR